MINAAVSGRGEPLIILHGLFGNLDNLRSVTVHFERHHEVHRLDLPGHGMSESLPKLSIPAMAEQIEAYLDENNISQCAILGHSLGGKVAMMMAKNDTKKRINKMIVADIAPRLYPPHHQEIFDALLSVDLSAVVNRSDAEKMLRGKIAEAGVRAFMLKSLVRAEEEDETTFKWQFDLQGLNDSYGAIRKMPAITRKINIPTLFIKGGASDYIVESDIALIQKRFKNATLREIPKVGHWLHAEKPAVFSRLCTDFLKQNHI